MTTFIENTSRISGINGTRRNATRHAAARERRIVNENRNPNQTNSLMTVRDRLFHAIFFKSALVYARIFPQTFRRCLEMFILLKALLAFLVLIYIHCTFLKAPVTCLEDIKNSWPRDGVLRVEISNIRKSSSLNDPNSRRETQPSSLVNLKNMFGPLTETELHKQLKAKLSQEKDGYYINETIIELVETKEEAFNYRESDTYFNLKNNVDELLKTENEYAVEYSMEYGYLRLSPSSRRRLKIPVMKIVLDASKNKCFGDSISRYVLAEYLGYDDLLMASVRVIAEEENNKGYLRNVITGEHYRFVSIWWTTWSSYPTAFCVMILFTISISMLLRYSHHQIFVFIVDLLQMLEFNISVRFPFAPLLTVILALVGMEAIMSEFFNDTSTAFYIILIVWLADQYDAICCHTNLTKRHWLRFFYLYHFSFYAYHYRFNGQYSSLALMASWLFIQHSMIYFFHHYELPVIIQQSNMQQIFVLTRQSNQNLVSRNVNATNDNQSLLQNEHNSNGNNFLLNIWRSALNNTNVFLNWIRMTIIRLFLSNTQWSEFITVLLESRERNQEHQNSRRLSESNIISTDETNQTENFQPEVQHTTNSNYTQLSILESNRTRELSVNLPIVEDVSSPYHTKSTISSSKNICITDFSKVNFINGYNDTDEKKNSANSELQDQRKINVSNPVATEKQKNSNLIEIQNPEQQNSSLEMLLESRNSIKANQIGKNVQLD